MNKVITIAAVLALMSGAALAAGGSGNTTSAPAATSPAASSPAGGSPAAGATPPTNSPMAMHCKTGEVVKTITKMHKKSKSCVKLSGSLLDDRDLYHQGWVLAKAGKYDWAIQVLSSVKNQNTPDVLTMLGYSNRKAGRIDTGVAYYKQALALEPNFVRAREYLGEGYVVAGKVDLARAQLDEIQKICGTGCSEYKDLSKAIAQGGA